MSTTAETQSDPTLAALLKAIIADPADDLARMAYADRCDEAGDRARAEFIRVQLKIAALEREGLGWPFCAKCGRAAGWYDYTPRCYGEVCRLRMREYYSSRRFINWGWRAGVPQSIAVTYGRGFVSEVSGHLDLLLEYLPAAVRLHPVERAGAVDREPVRDTHDWNWCEEHGLPRAARLPHAVFVALQGGTRGKDYRIQGTNVPLRRYHWYGSRKAALDALSDALLRLARAA